MGTQNTEKKYVYIGGEPIEVVESADALRCQLGLKSKNEELSDFFIKSIFGIFSVCLAIFFLGLVAFN